MYTDGPLREGYLVLNSINDPADSALTEKKFSCLCTDMLNVSNVGKFFMMRSVIPPQLSPIRQVLKPSAIHFSGGLSGISGISNSMFIWDLLLSMLKEKRVIFPIRIGVVNTWLKKILLSKSFQNFISLPQNNNDLLLQLRCQYVCFPRDVG